MRYLTVIALILCAQAALADRLLIRSGDHAEFTRFVLTFDERPAWSAGRTQNGYALLFESEDEIVVDQSRASPRRSRRRGVVNGRHRQDYRGLRCQGTV